MLISYPTRRDTISLTNTCKNKKLSCCCDSRSHCVRRRPNGLCYHHHHCSACTNSARIAPLAANNLQTSERGERWLAGILTNYIKPVSVTSLRIVWYARFDSTGRVYQRTQSTQAWPLSVTDQSSVVHEISE